LDLLRSIGVYDLGKVLLKSEVSLHLIGQASQLTKFWNEGDLVTSLAILVDEQGLVDVGHSLIVLRLVVLEVADSGSILFECGLW